MPRRGAFSLRFYESKRSVEIDLRFESYGIITEPGIVTSAAYSVDIVFILSLRFPAQVAWAPGVPQPLTLPRSGGLPCLRYDHGQVGVPGYILRSRPILTPT